MYTPSPDDVRALRRDKYGDVENINLHEDLERLRKGEPLAYVIGWIPFLGLTIHLDTRPLIPRPETEWWTEKLITHLRERFGHEEFSFLDLCAGSGAIGLSVLAKLPGARVTFLELISEHASLIKKNIEVNGLAGSRATILTSDLFEKLEQERFDVIASNPPYVPAGRVLPEGVTGFEPHVALYAGSSGLSLIERIAHEVSSHLTEGGELWIEVDAEHGDEARDLFKKAGARKATLHTDQYGRPRLVVSYWSHA